MKRSFLIAGALALAACQAEPAPDNATGAQPSANVGFKPAAAAARKVEEKSDTLEFTYSWPAEAAAIPGLRKQLEEELGRDRVEAVTAAKEDKAAMGQDGGSFFAHSFSKAWRLAGNTPRLLSMISEASTFTGGLHPNTDHDGIIWDRQAGKLVSFEELFSSNQVIPALSSRYCKGLDAARLEKRGEVIPPSPDDFMTACSPLAEQAVVPADTNGNGRLDVLQIWLPPSVAGPHAESSYQVDLNIDPATLWALKPEYRNLFEADRAQPQ